MKAGAFCTDGTAKIYREAARLSEKHGMGESSSFCCNAIFITAEGADDGDLNWCRRDSHPLVVAFHRVYRPDGEDEGDPYFGDDFAARVVALCFMAAMVEAGDA